MAKNKIRQKRVRKELSANPSISLAEAMRRAGYSKSYARKPNEFFRTIAGKKIVTWLNFEISQIEKEMNKKREEARYKDLADTLVNLKKLQQLLEGKETENIRLKEEQTTEMSPELKEAVKFYERELIKREYNKRKSVGLGEGREN